MGKQQKRSRGLKIVFGLGATIGLATLAILSAPRWLRSAHSSDGGDGRRARWSEPAVNVQTGVMRFAEEALSSIEASTDDAPISEAASSLARVAAAAASAAAAMIDRVVLRCPEYAGPLIWAWFPGGKNLRMREVAASRLEAPAELRPVDLPARPFALGAARLLPGSRFHAAFETNRAFLTSLDADRMLFSFREHHGLTQPLGADGKPPRPYGGWEAPHSGIRGHFVGHLLSALAMHAAAEPEGELARKGRYMVSVLADCAAKHGTGYVSAFPEAELAKHEDHCTAHGCTWVAYYTQHKILQGILDQHLLAHSAHALPLAAGLARYLCARVRAAIAERGLEWWLDGLALEVGGMAEALVLLARALDDRVAGDGGAGGAGGPGGPGGSASELLQCAALFERPCFAQPLALAGAVAAAGKAADQTQEDGGRRARTGGAEGGSGTVGAGSAADSVALREAELSVRAAMEGKHANTHLPVALGAMAMWEATAAPGWRGVGEALWAELNGSHTFATGGSTFGEQWRRRRAQGEVLAHAHAGNLAAHEHHESCVTHNSMRINAKLMAWRAPQTPPLRTLGGGGPGGGAGSSAGEPRADTPGSRAGQGAHGGAHAGGFGPMLSHAEYEERALLNAVLGTQRGTEPGAMLYMFPMGGGVSKAGVPNAPQCHFWSDAERHFWCCLGSGAEAFSRLGALPFWAHGPDDLLVLQYVPSELRWAHAAHAGAGPDGATARALGPDAPQPARRSVLLDGGDVGALRAGERVRVRVRIGPLEPAPRAPREARRARVHVRVPQWAHEAAWSVAGAAVALGGAHAWEGGGFASLELRPAMPAGAAAPATARGLAGALAASLFGGAEGSTAAAAARAPRGAEGSDAEGFEAEGVLLLTAGLRAEKAKDDRAAYRSLHALLYGPLVLAALTTGPRALRVDAPPPGVLRPTSGAREDGGAAQPAGPNGWKWVHPLPERARTELASLRLLTAVPGVPSPSAAGAAPVRMPVLLHHAGEGREAVLARRAPNPPNRTRPGGSDAAHAATFRLARAPAISLVAGGEGAARPQEAGGSRGDGNPLADGDAIVLEPFDRPGFALGARVLDAAGWRARARRQPDGEGCLVRAFEPAQVWVVHADGSRNFVPRPNEPCRRRAAAVRNVQAIPKRDGPSDTFALSDAAARAACAELPPCALARDGSVDLAVAFAQLEAALASAPQETVLIELQPAEPVPAPAPASAAAPRGAAEAAGAGQWWIVRLQEGQPCSIQLESAAFPGRFLGVRASTPPAAGRQASNGGGAFVHREALLVAAQLGLTSAAEPHGASALVPASFALEPPLAHYPPLAFWLAPRRLPTAAAALAAEPRVLLAYALNEVIDEHYAPYLCLLGEASSEPPPAFCS